jgi:hypothetical protein
MGVVVQWIARLALIIWLALMVYAGSRGAAAGEAQIILGIALLPLGLLWFLGWLLAKLGRTWDVR